MSFKLFDVKKKNFYKLTSHEKKLAVISENVPKFLGRWITIQGVDSVKTLKQKIVFQKLPTIITFSAQLKGFSKICIHAVIITSNSDNALYAIDPLGKKVMGKDLHNIVFGQIRINTKYLVTGANYLIDYRRPIMLLTRKD